MLGRKSVTFMLDVIFLAVLFGTHIRLCLSHIDGTALQNVKFNRHLQNHIITVLFHLSLQQCHDECLARARCRSYNYRRLFPLCELSDSDSIASSNDFGESESVIYSEKKDWALQTLDGSCSICANKTVCELSDAGVASCMTRECGDPPIFPHADPLGNMNRVGAKIAYKCQTQFRMVGPVTQSECLESGNWSKTNFACIHTDCWTPTTLNDTLSNVIINGTDVMVLYKCTSNYVTRASPIMCNAHSGIYNSAKLQTVCCDDPDVKPWIRVFRLIEHGNVYVNGFWASSSFMPDGANLQGCQFRNEDILDRWTDMDIDEVKVELFENDTVHAWVIFDGTNTNIHSWFSKNKLINSSWTDLMPGNNAWIAMGTTQGRFVITNGRFHVDNCSLDHGWLLIKVQYPCGPVTTNGLMILYAPGNTMSSYNETVIGRATKMEISVKLKEL